VIVVDDGSSDDVEQALAPLRDRIELIRKPNGGGASARNRGIEAVETEFMAILDADDLYDRRRLGAIAEAARRRPDLDIVTTDARLVVEGRPAGSFASTTPFVVEGQRTAIFETCFPGGWPAVRKRALEAVGGFDEAMRIAYDWDCWLRLLLAGAAAGMVAEPLYDYVILGDSLAANRTASLWERARLLQKARGNPDLREDERPRLERAIHWRRSEALREEIRALAAGGRRSDLLRLLRTADVDARARAVAGLGTLAPGLARRLLGPPGRHA
jgi:glycosyltransferase involved in cell wall biosynthesis